MISLFRNFARSKWAAGLLVLVGIALLVGGARMDVFSNLGPKHIVTAGNRSIDAAEFTSDFERVRKNISEQAGRPVTVADMVKENLHVRYLEEQTQRMGFLDWAWKAGIQPGKSLVIKQIRQIPAFFNSVTGQFDQATYEQALAAQNVTPVQLEREFRDQYVTSHFGSAVVAGLRLPRIYGAVLAANAMETRDGRWFSVTQAMAGTAPAPTDAQLTAFMSEMAAQLRNPEYRMTAVALFDDGPNAAPPAIPEARIVERFNFRKDALSTPEKRTFTTLTAPTKAAADRIAAALRAGQTPAQAGQANGNIRPAVFNETPRTAVAEAPVAAAVFGLAANQVSDPVQGAVGFTVAQVTAIAPGAPATLESARSTIIQQLQEEDAKTRLFARVQKYEAARNDGKTLVQGVAEAGGRIVQLPPFTQDGKLPDGRPVPAPPQIIQAAWTLSKGGESDVIDAGQGQYFVLRLDDIRPAGMPTLAEVREPLTQAWMRQQNARLISTKAEELATRIRGGAGKPAEDIAAVAASVGAPLRNQTGVARNQETQTALGQGVLQGLFGQGRGQVFVGPESASAYVVGRVDAIRPAVPALAAPMAEQARLRLADPIGNAMVQSAFVAGAQQTKAKNDPAAAMQALNITPPAPGAPATPTP